MYPYPRSALFKKGPVREFHFSSMTTKECGCRIMTNLSAKGVVQASRSRYKALYTQWSKAKNSGMTHKVWKSSISRTPRPAHDNAVGQTVLIDDDFIIGGIQMFLPNDPSAPIAQTANCKCSVKYVAKPLSLGQPIRAYEQGRDVIIVYAKNVEEVRSGGTRAWRNNNPGNMRNYAFSKSLGSIGEAGGFAVFPSEKIGLEALLSLLKTKTYQSLTIIDAISRYAPPNENNTANYQKFVEGATGISNRTGMAALNKSQLDKVVNAIRRIEGWIVGNIKWR